MFGRRLLRLWGQFVGTYSTLAYAGYAGWGGRVQPVRCRFAIMPKSIGGLRTLAYADALINLLSRVRLLSRRGDLVHSATVRVMLVQPPEAATSAGPD